jgi:hypothetical protein
MLRESELGRNDLQRVQDLLPPTHDRVPARADEILGRHKRQNEGRTPAKEFLSRHVDRETTGRRLRNRIAKRALRNRTSLASYDAVVVVVFDQDFRVVEVLRVPRAAVEEFFAVNQQVNGRIIELTKKLRSHPPVTSIDLSAPASR